MRQNSNHYVPRGFSRNWSKERRPPRSASIRQSLYTFYLRHDRGPNELLELIRNRVNMNSYDTRNQNFRLQTHNRNQVEKKSHRFKLQLPNSDIFIEKELDILYDVHNQDLLAWTDKFQELRNMFQWDESLAIQVLKASVAEQLSSSINEAQTLEVAIRELFSLRFSSISIEALYREANMTFQDNFLFINDYTVALQKVVRQMTIVKNWNEDFSRTKFEEYFYLGLADRTRLEMNKNNIRDVRTITENIQRTEDLLIKVATENEIRCKQNEQLRGHRNEANGNSEENQRNFRGNIYRHNNTYSGRSQTSYDRNRNPQHFNYRNRDREGRNNQGRNDSRNANHPRFDNTGSDREERLRHGRSFAVKEACPKLKSIVLCGVIRNKQVSCLLDSGSDESYIQEETALEMNLETENTKIKTIEVANNETVKVEKKVEVLLELKSTPAAEYKMDLYLMKNMSIEVILGMDFLQKFSCILNFKEPLLTIDGHAVELETDKNMWSDSPDKILDEKSKVCCVKMSPEERIKQVVMESKKKNPLLGLIDGYEHHILLTNTSHFGSNGYTVPLSLSQELKDEIKKLLELKIIKYSTSTWISAAFPILKRNGKIRLIIDYRRLNSVTEKDTYPIPEVMNKIYELRGSAVFSTIDLNMGYYQIKVEENSQKYTAFVLDGQVYEFARMPFGLTNAPRTFQRAINEVVRGVKNTAVFMDDIVVYSSTMEEHADNLKALLETLHSKNISINFEKCSFAKTEIRYLGLVVNQLGVKPDEKRLYEFKWKIPRTRKQLEKLLGLINWFRPFIKNLSERICSLTDRLRSNKFTKLTDEEVTAIKEIFEEISSGRILSFPNETDDYQLETDASENSIGGVLLQGTTIIGFFSKKLTDAERRYPIQEKEALAVIKALEYFRKFIFNSKVTIYCDNQNLFYDKENLRQKTQRWKLVLAEYNIEFRRIAGVRNCCADFISRANTILARSNIYDIQELSEEQKEDSIIRKKLNEGSLVNENLSGYQLACTNEKKVYIPKSLLKTYILRFHKLIGHSGATKLIGTLGKFWTSHNLARQIRLILEECVPCKKNKDSNYKYGLRQTTLHEKKPLTKLCADILGPFSGEFLKSDDSITEFYFLSIVDCCTRFSMLSLVTRITGSEVVRCFEKWVGENEKPVKIVTDQGKQFCSRVFEDWCNDQGIRHQINSAYNPQANGIVERQNAFVSNVVRINRDLPKEKLEELVNFSINNSFHRRLGFTPNELKEGRSIWDPWNREIEINFDELGERMQKFSEEEFQRKSNFIKRTYKVGEKVFVKNQNANKIDEKYKGPFGIVEISKSGNSIKVDYGEKLQWCSVRNIKPLKTKGEKNVAVHD